MLDCLMEDMKEESDQICLAVFTGDKTEVCLGVR